jgi:hypothetical protein
MERFCITLDQAKRLEELGAFSKFGEGLVSWYVVHHKRGEDTVHFNYVPTPYDHLPVDAYEAYHVGELLEILPNEIDDGSGNYFLTKRGQLRGYLSPDNRWLVQIQGTQSEAEAFGQLLIYLLENNLI